jgi:hypothetical protein
MPNRQHDPVRTATRTTTPGAELRLLILGVQRHEVIGVDLASGAFVRARAPRAPVLSPYDIGAARLAADEPIETPHAPESVELATAVEIAGRLSRRRVERYLRPLEHPRHQQLLGFAEPSLPFWAMTGDRPSVALISPVAGPAVVRNADGWRCRFLWRTHDHDLPLVDARVVHALGATGRTRFSGDDLNRALGRRPQRILVAIADPVDGLCHKVAAALLPRP